MSFAVAILVLLVVWVAVRAVGPAEASKQPAVVLPSMPQVPVEPSVVPSSPVSVSPSRAGSSASPSPSVSSASPTASSRSVAPRALSPSPSVSSPSVRVTTSPVPSKTSTPPAPAASATLSVNASWRSGYVATARLQNTGTAPLSWKMTVTHADVDNLRLLGAWNAHGTRDGDTIILTGGPLAPGASATFGYQASARGDARPSGCSVVGGSCRMS